MRCASYRRRAKKRFLPRAFYRVYALASGGAGATLTGAPPGRSIQAKVGMEFKGVRWR